MRFLATLGFFTICMWAADFIWGATLALRGFPHHPQICSIFAAFAYGLFGGTP